MFTFRVNGDTITVPAWDPQRTLLEFLRATGLTGSKEGCAEGECGACAVAMVVSDRGRTLYRVVNSCLLLLPMASGREFYTVEGLAAHGVLQGAQEAMAAAGGSQCGYCTPGFVVSLFAEQHRPDRTGPCDIQALAGNLCRCTGYRPIRDAALSLGPAPESQLRHRLTEPVSPLSALATDTYSRPSSIGEIVDRLHAQPDAAVVAGATDLGVEWNLRRRRWAHLVDLDAVEELHDSEEGASAVRLGAAVPLSELAARWSSAPPAVQEWLTLFASPLIRNRATLGGNLGTASPIGDAAPLLLALDALVELAGPGGRRVVPVSTFFVGYRKTVRQPEEIIVSIRIPRPYAQRLAFYKVSKRPLDDISTVAAAMAVDIDAGARVSRARFAFGGVSATPLLVSEAADAVVGRPWNADAVSRVQEILTRTLAPLSDHRGSERYRRDVSSSLVEKFWWEHKA